MSTGTSHSYPSTPVSHNQYPPLAIIITISILIFILVGFLSVILFKCLMESVLNGLNLWHTTPSTNFVTNADTPANNGLDPSIIKSFPSFLYSSVKDLRKEKYGLECAICLVEFQDDSMLRLLTSCCHVFHQECIDLWLEYHTTCPVCRGNLDSSTPENENNPVDDETGEEVVQVSIEIRNDDDDEGQENEGEKILKISTRKVEEGGNNKEREEYNEKDRFSRSHSTGHSIVRIRSEKGEEDKYTLRLPEHVKAKSIRGHHWTGSCTTFREISRHKDCGLGEMSGCACI